jgi:hypothetical protein
MSGTIARLRSNSLVHMGIAFLLMGSWALFANRDHGEQRMVMAGLIQGALSACLTLFLKSAIEFLARRFFGWVGLVAPPIIACIGSACILIAIHFVGGTPEIAKTIAVPLAVSTSYAALYNYSISRKRIKRNDANR